MWQQPWHFFTISGGFRRGRGTIDLVFVARLLREKMVHTQLASVLFVCAKHEADISIRSKVIRGNP